MRKVYDVSQETIRGSQIQIALGIAAIGLAIAFVPLAPILTPAAGALISEGICDIAFELLSQGNSQFNLK